MNTIFKKAMGRTGALAFAAVLPILLAAPATWADTSYEVDDTAEGPCLPPIFTDPFVLNLPDINFRGVLSGAASLQENVPGDSTLFSGEVFNSATGVKISVEVRMSDKESCTVPTIPSPGACENTATYGCFSSWSGKLVILVDPLEDPNFKTVDAEFSLTGTSELLFGEGAYIFSTKFGVRGQFQAQLDDPGSFPGLPDFPLMGELRFVIDSAAAVVPRADASVIGTWDGTLDCIGQQGQTTDLFSTNDTSTAATLLIAQEGAKLGENTYCVNLPVSPAGTSVEGQLASPVTVKSIEGTRQLLSPASFEPQGYVKYDGTTLKLRLLRSEGQLDNIDFCKGEFTLMDSTEPSFVVSGECDTTGIFLSVDARVEFCDTVICGPGTICENAETSLSAGHGSPVVCLFIVASP